MPLDGLACVIEEIQKDLLNLMGVHQHGWQCRIQLRHHLNITRAQLIGHDLQHAIDQLVKMGQLALRLMLTRKAQQTLNDLLTSPSALRDTFDKASLLVGSSCLLQ